MWRLYFYGEQATTCVRNLEELAAYVNEVGLPEDMEWFEVAPIKWEEVNAGFIYRQFTGRGEPPPLQLVHR